MLTHYLTGCFWIRTVVVKTALVRQQMDIFVAQYLKSDVKVLLIET